MLIIWTLGKKNPKTSCFPFFGSCTCTPRIPGTSHTTSSSTASWFSSATWTTCALSPVSWMAWNQVNARSCSPVSSATWPRKRSRWPSWLVQWQSSQPTITARWVGSCVLHGLLGLWMVAQLQSSMPCPLRSSTVSLPSWRGELSLVLRGLLCLWIEAQLQSSTPCRLRSQSAYHHGEVSWVLCTDCIVCCGWRHSVKAAHLSSWGAEQSTCHYPDRWSLLGWNYCSCSPFFRFTKNLAG